MLEIPIEVEALAAANSNGCQVSEAIYKGARCVTGKVLKTTEEKETWMRKVPYQGKRILSRCDEVIIYLLNSTDIILASVRSVREIDVGIEVGIGDLSVISAVSNRMVTKALLPYGARLKPCRFFGAIPASTSFDRAWRLSQRTLEDLGSFMDVLRVK